MSGRMNNESRESFFRAEHATIMGRDDHWWILLSRSSVFTQQHESWWVQSGGTAVTYSSSYAAVQAIQRVRKDIPWKIFESKPRTKSVANEAFASKSLKEHMARTTEEGLRAQPGQNADGTNTLATQEKSENKVHENLSLKNEMNIDQLNEMARAAWALSELGHIPSTTEELNQVLNRLNELRNSKV